METLENLYETAKKGHYEGWDYLPLKTMTEKNGKKATREFLEKEIQAHKDRDTSTLHSAHFTCDGDERGHWAGYTTLRTWNGWATPYFTKEIADQITEHFNRFMDKPIVYDAKKDAYLIDQTEWGLDEEPLEVKGEDAVTPDGVRHLYALGSGYWCWDEDEKQ